MAAGTYNFVIEQGATFSKNIEWNDEDGTPVPLDGLTGLMRVRSSLNATEVILEFTTDDTTMVFTDPGVITLAQDSDVTAALDFTMAVYDLKILDPSVDPPLVTRLLKGTVQLSKEVTK
jgi:hypothetical protein